MNALKVSLQVALTICLSSFAINYSVAQTTIEVSGNITTNTTWADDTVNVIGNVTISDDITLTINPGTYVEFQGYYHINISGYLKAEGTPGDTIIFTINDNTYGTIPGSFSGKWQNINFVENSLNDTSILSICHLSYAHGRPIYKSGSHNLIISNCHIENNYTDFLGGGFFSSNNDGITLIEKCLINNNEGFYGGGIGIMAGENVAVLDNTICNNKGKYGAGVYINNGNGGTFSGNVIRNNNSYGGGGIAGGGWNIEITNNKIINNTAYNGGAFHGWFFHNSLFMNNVLINNEATMFGGGVYCKSSTIDINNNLIANNQGSVGGGIYLFESTVNFIGNTICNNQANVGGGFYLNSSESQVSNTILWGNSASTGNQIYIYDNFSSPGIYYCVIQDGLDDLGFEGSTTYQGRYENNFEINPVFESTSSGTGIQPDAEGSDWNLQHSSPCINNGNPDMSGLIFPDIDLDKGNRIWHGRIDIGAYEAHIERITAHGAMLEDTVWVADTVFVTGDIYVPDDVTLTISPGTRVLFDGHFKIGIHGRLIARGTFGDSIFFEVTDTTGFSDHTSTAGSWDGIDFNNGYMADGANGAMNDNDTSVLSFCVIKYAKSKGKHGGGLFIDHFSKISIENSKITFCGDCDLNGGAIYCSYASPFISDCDISHNFCKRGGVGIFCMNSELHIKNSIIADNISIDGHGAGLYFGNSSPVIENCLIINNKSSGANGGLYSNMSDPLIINCKIINNFCSSTATNPGGALCFWYGKPVLINNLISNNLHTWAEGYLEPVYFREVEDALLINNTIVNNASVGLAFRSSKARIYNSILWGNEEEQIRIIDAEFSDIIKESDINIYNCLIQGEVNQEYFNEGSIGDFVNVQDIIPGFNAPIDNTGSNEFALLADWRVNQFSPCINSGQNEITGVILPENDLAGFSRINGSLIDIGAFEHQGGLLQIIKQPSGGTRCAGVNFMISIETNDSAQYQWQKDGIDIQGEIKSELIIDQVNKNDQGSYWCVVSNSYGSVTSSTATLFVNELPEFLQVPQDLWAKIDQNVVLRTYANGTNLDLQWQKDGINMPGEHTPDLAIPGIDYPAEGTYRCIAGNTCGSDTTPPVNLFLVPQICMVTVDPATGNNLVIWEKNTKAPLEAYNVYRESSAASIYDLMGTVPGEDLSIYVDTSANPTVQAYLYKITGVDTSGFETDIDLCKPHKTIHLLVSTNPELNTTQLEWDRYYGFVYPTYRILRSPTRSNFIEVHSLASSLESWTDPTPLPETGFYRISVAKPDPCYPTGGGKKADSGPYSHSISNVEDNRLQAGESPPDTIMLTKSNIDENNIYGALIGRLQTFDADTLDSHTYIFASGEGDLDNMSFTILGDLLLAAEIYDYETKTEYSIRVRCKDEGNLTREEIFVIQVNDVDDAVGMHDGTFDQIMTYPNPFGESTTIMFNNPEGNIFTLYITDLSGKLCRIVNDINTSEYVLERKNLEKGIYFLELTGPRTYRGKIIIE